MPIVNPVITKIPLIDALDIIDEATVELIEDGDTITTIYPLIIKSLDLTGNILDGGNEIHILTGYDNYIVSDTVSTDNISTFQCENLTIGEIDLNESDLYIEDNYSTITIEEKYVRFNNTVNTYYTDITLTE